MANHVLREDQKDWLIAEYASGRSANGIAQELGVSWHVVGGLLKERGVFEGMKRSKHDDRDASICARYSAGETQHQIADSLGMSRTRVLAILVERGVVTRARGVPRPVHVERIVELRKQGWGARRIAKELGIGETTAKKWIAAHGLNDEGLRGRPSGPGHQRWQGGVHVMQGYRTVIVPRDDPMHVMAWKNNYVMEHRLVMARSLGRPLEKHETVHHINGDKLDNRLENLQLRSGQHGKGARFVCADCGSHNVRAAEL